LANDVRHHIRAQKGECKADGRFDIIRFIQVIHLEVFAIKAPSFRHTERSVKS
jgi:hypothetical protein